MLFRSAGEGFRFRLLALGAGGFHGAGEGAGGILPAGFLPLVSAAVRVRFVRRPFGFGVHIHIRGGADRGEGIAQGGFSGGAVIDHDSNIHPVAAVVELGLGGGMVLVKRDVEKPVAGLEGRTPPMREPVTGMECWT